MNMDNYNDFQLIDKTIILTGGAGLLGKQFVIALLKAGANVVVTDLTDESAESVARESMKAVGGEALGFKMDVTDPNSIRRCLDCTLNRFGSIHGLINNAGLDPKFDRGESGEHTYSFEDFPLELWQKSLDVNLTGPYLCCQIIGQAIQPDCGGSVVNIISTYGLVAPDQRLYLEEDGKGVVNYKPAYYPVTKAGLAHLTRYLAVYWAPKGVRVNSLTPGGIENQQSPNFIKRYSYRTPMGRMAQKHEMNGALVFLLSEGSSYMTGANLVVDGGWTAW